MTAPAADVETLELARLAEALERTAAWIRRTTPPGEWNLVAVSTLDGLERLGPQRVSDLVARESTSQPGMTGIVARLAAAGLVDRTPDPRDGRATLVSITADGRDYLAGRHAARARTVAGHLGRLPAADRGVLVAATSALDRLASLPVDAPPDAPPADSAVAGGREQR